MADISNLSDQDLLQQLNSIPFDAGNNWQQNIGQGAAKIGLNLGSGFLGAIPDIISMPYNLMAKSGNPDDEETAVPAGLPLSIPSLTQYLANKVDQATANTPYTTAPTSVAGRIIRAGTQTLGGGLGLNAVGDLAGGSNILNSLGVNSAQQGLSFLGAGAAGQAGEEISPGNTYLSPALAYLGALLGHHAPGAGAIDATANRAANEVGKMFDGSPESQRGSIDLSPSNTTSQSTAIPETAAPNIDALINGETQNDLTQEQMLRRQAGERYGVRMFTGDITQNPNHQGYLDDALKGAYEEKAQELAQNAVQGQKQDLQNMTSNIATQLNGGQVVPDNISDITGHIRDAVQQAADNSQANVTKAYADVKAAGSAGVQPTAFQPFYDASSDLMKNSNVIKGQPSTISAIQEVNDLLTNSAGKPVDVNDIEASLQNINSLYSQAQNSSDRAGVMQIKTALKDSENGAVTNGLVVGNPDAINKYVAARALASKDFETFGNNKLIQQVLDDNQTNPTISGKIFGGGAPGTFRQAKTAINTIQNAVGADHPIMGEIKAGMYQKLAPPSIFNQTDLSPTIAGKYASNVSKLFTADPDLVNTLYNPAEKQLINDSAQYVAKPIATRQPGAINTSNTVNVSKRILKAVGGADVMVISPIAKKLESIGNVGKTKKLIAGEIPPEPTTLTKAVVKPNLLPQTIIGTNNSQSANHLAGMSDADLLNALKGNSEAAQPNPLPPVPANGNQPTAAPQPQQPLPPIPVSQAQPAIQAPAAPSDNPVLAGIDNASKATGVPANLLHTIAAAESNLNPLAKNPNSSAKGLFQMTQGTWKQMVNKYGDQFGIGYKDINDPQANATMAAMLTQDNAARMQNKLGRAPTTGEIYLAHFMGVPGAVKLMQNPDAKAASLFPAAAKANRSLFFDGSTAKTAATVYHEITGKVQDIIQPEAEAAEVPAPIAATPEQQVAMSSVPEVAKAALIKNPDKASEFDQMFGNGLAQLILQNK